MSKVNILFYYKFNNIVSKYNFNYLFILFIVILFFWEDSVNIPIRYKHIDRCLGIFDKSPARDSSIGFMS